MLGSIRHSPGGEAASTPPREAAVRVRGGYDPETIYAEVGVPLRIAFRGEESGPCSEQVAFPAFGKSATLSQGEKIPVGPLPETPDDYEFTCVGMLRGKPVVVSPGEPAT